MKHFIFTNSISKHLTKQYIARKKIFRSFLQISFDFSFQFGLKETPLCSGYIKTRSSQMRPDKTMPYGARQKNRWLCLASWTRSLPETWRKLTTLCQITPDFVFFCKQSKILVLSGTIWSCKLLVRARKIEPEFGGLVHLAWLHLAVWIDYGPWCNQSISLLRQDFF